MHRRVLDFFRPNSITGWKAFGGSVLATVAIFLIDFQTGTEIRLGALYVLPIAFVGLHCHRQGYLVSIIGLSVLFQSVSSVRSGISVPAVIIDIGVGLMSAGLVGVLASAVLHDHDELAIMSQTDALTGLQNRRGFELKLATEIERQKRYGGVFSLALIDLDKFKELNDSRGHAEGDRALVIVAEVLRAAIRDSDSSARLGGDEFSVLFLNTRREECEIVCRQLLARIRDSMQKSRFEVTASIGASTFERPPESLEAAFDIVDRAMYRAKAEGRNAVVSI